MSWCPLSLGIGIGRWRWIGAIEADDLKVWVFGMDLPGVPHKSLDVIKNSLDPVLDTSVAQAAVFPAARERWRLLWIRHSITFG